MKIALFFLVLTIYVISSPPALMTGDGGEFITSACTLGISHPPGYPLYCLVEKICTFLPLSNPAWRVTFGSILFSVFSALLLFVLLKEITKNEAVSLFTALVYSFSSTVWSQAIVAKVYPLNAFFVLLCLVFLIFWQKHEDNRYFYLFALVFGLSLSNHYPLMLIASHAFLSLIIMNFKYLNIKTIITSAIFAVLGCLVYSYLPIRAAAHPPNNWGNPHDAANFLAHVLRKQYKLLEFGQKIPLSDKIKFIVFFFQEILKQFNLFSGAALLGAIVIFKENKKLFVSLLLLFLTNGVFLTYILQFAYNPERLGIVSVYYIPAYISVSIFAGIGLNYLYLKMKQSLHKVILTMVIMLSFLAVFAYSFENNYNRNDFLAYDYGKNIVSFLKKDSTLFIVKAGDESLFSSLFVQKVMRKREDLKIIDCWGNVFVNIYSDDFTFITDKNKWLNTRKTIEGALVKATANPAYYLSFAPEEIGSGFSLKNDGMFYAVDKAEPANSKDNVWQLYNYRGIYAHSFRDYQEREIAGYYFYAQGNIKNNTESDSYLKKAAFSAFDVDWLVNNIGLSYYRNGDFNKAKYIFTKLLKSYPTDFSAWFNLGLVYKAVNIPLEAEQCFEKCVKLNPQDLDSFKELADVLFINGKHYEAGKIYNNVLKGNKKYADLYYASGTSFYMKKEYLKAIDEWQKALLVKPDYAIIYYNMGVAYADMRDYAKAKQVLEKFLSLDQDTGSTLHKNVQVFIKNMRV
jgi:tetratricopeptide (TPR) repeat protein